MTVRITVKNGDPPGDGKICENRFWPISDGLQGKKPILPYFYIPRGVAESAPFPEVRNRKGAESGLRKSRVFGRQNENKKIG